MPNDTVTSYADEVDSLARGDAGQGSTEDDRTSRHQVLPGVDELISPRDPADPADPANIAACAGDCAADVACVIFAGCTAQLPCTAAV